ncbi:hypothetical protein LTR78_010527 [Recurvomyces mirabilis]|uniref:Uncharacterized protein n=1 Tax=Recurvomyces mirabilis TaxID=574656 RepID=A0AAE0TMZ2_9PEZI|nr:hypothetical protein LTR78_010527 [Recurvomyces mirabilis]KAK5149605.1 hypothetical protein LTS14_010807 [Recurvomyces mirabilis]
MARRWRSLIRRWHCNLKPRSTFGGRRWSVAHPPSFNAAFGSTASKHLGEDSPVDSRPIGAKHRYKPDRVRASDSDAHKTDKWNYLPDVHARNRSWVSLAALEVQKRLKHAEARPVDILRSSLEARAIDISTIEVCLAHHFKQLSAVSKKEMSDYACAQPVAALIIQYLLQNYDAWLHFVLRRGEAMIWLTYSAVAEGLEDILLDWVKVDIDETKAETAIGPMWYVWRGLFFRSVIQAHLRHAQSVSADRALQVFIEMLEALQQRIRSYGPQWLTLSLYPAAVELVKALCRPGWTKTDPALQMEVAVLHLRHPTTPNPGPAITLFKRQFDGKTKQEAIASLPPTHAKGLREDALWLEDKASEIFPRPQKIFRFGNMQKGKIKVVEGEIPPKDAAMFPDRLTRSGTDQDGGVRSDVGSRSIRKISY